MSLLALCLIYEGRVSRIVLFYPFLQVYGVEDLIGNSIHVEPTIGDMNKGEWVSLYVAT